MPPSTPRTAIKGTQPALPSSSVLALPPLLWCLPAEAEEEEEEEEEEGGWIRRGPGRARNGKLAPDKDPLWSADVLFFA